jgi:putative endonuclease
MPSDKRKFGDVGERIAEKYLIKKGYRIIGRNFYRPWGEIDIIAIQKNILVFFEVKARQLSSGTSFLPEHNVHTKKAQRLRRICETYVTDESTPNCEEWRIDILAIDIDIVAQKAHVRHFENAIWDKQR